MGASSSCSRAGAIVLTLTVAAAGTVVAGVKVQSQGDKSFAFASLKTWAWNPSGPGDVKVWVSANSDPAPVKRQWEPVIVNEVEQQLSGRKFARADASPDFFVTYYLLITLGMATQQMGQFLPAVTEWGVPPFAPQTSSLKIYPEGALVIDVAAGSTEHVVWRGMAQSDINIERSDAEREKRLREAVKDLLARFPPKK